LLSQRYTDAAKIGIIRPEVTIFSIEWCRIEVTEDRFAVGTTHEAYFERLAELVIKTFRILEHSPIRVMGINYDVHFRVESEEKWHEFGHKLTPKGIWARMFDNPGMRSLTIEESIRPDGYEGRIQVKVEPSIQLHPGIYISVNDHYETKEKNKVLASKLIITILEKEHAKALLRSKEICQKIMEEV
jgi:hypothetical protein